MPPHVHRLFLIMVIIQGLHSIEEYSGALWASFPPATWLCGLVSENLETGFLIINVGLFICGMGCWFYFRQNKGIIARGLLWFWIIIGIINGIGHPLWSVSMGSYTPGLITAPLLLLLSVWLLRILLNDKRLPNNTIEKTI